MSKLKVKIGFPGFGSCIIQSTVSFKVQCIINVWRISYVNQNLFSEAATWTLTNGFAHSCDPQLQKFQHQTKTCDSPELHLETLKTQNTLHANTLSGCDMNFVFISILSVCSLWWVQHFPHLRPGSRSNLKFKVKSGLPLLKKLNPFITKTSQKIGATTSCLLQYTFGDKILVVSIFSICSRGPWLKNTQLQSENRNHQYILCLRGGGKPKNIGGFPGWHFATFNPEYRPPLSGWPLSA